MKACKDCRYHQWTFTSLFDRSLSRCKHPDFMESDPITGDKKHAFASIAREFKSLCGIKAVNFESKGKR